MLTSLFILSLANFALSILVTRSVLFEGLRGKFQPDSWIGKLLRCPLCFGTWNAIVLCFLNGFPSHDDIEGIYTMYSVKHIGIDLNIFSFEHYYRLDPIHFFTCTFAVVGLSAFFSYTWIVISERRSSL